MGEWTENLENRAKKIKTEGLEQPGGRNDKTPLGANWHDRNGDPKTKGGGGNGGRSGG